MFRQLCAGVAVLVVLCIGVTPAYSTGKIKGTVYDSAGSKITSADVIIRVFKDDGSGNETGPELGSDLSIADGTFSVDYKDSATDLGEGDRIVVRFQFQTSTNKSFIKGLLGRPKMGSGSLTHKAVNVRVDK